MKCVVFGWLFGWVFFYHYNMWFHNSFVMHLRSKNGKLEKADFEA